MSATVNVIAPELERFIQTALGFGQEVAGEQMRARIGERMRESIQQHFADLANDSQHHKTAESLGGTRTGFYEEAFDATQTPEIEEGAVSVSITGPKGLAQRYYGGTIHGDPWLTLPARAETYGHRAREFSNLRVIMFPGGEHGALVERKYDDFGQHTGGAKLGKKTIAPMDKLGSEVFFWLVKEVEQPADPTVLPSDEQILDPAIDAAQAYLDVLEQRMAA